MNSANTSSRCLGKFYSYAPYLGLPSLNQLFGAEQLEYKLILSRSDNATSLVCRYDLGYYRSQFGQYLLEIIY